MWLRCFESKPKADDAFGMQGLLLLSKLDTIPEGRSAFDAPRKKTRMAAEMAKAFVPTMAAGGWCRASRTSRSRKNCFLLCAIGNPGSGDKGRRVISHDGQHAHHGPLLA